MKRLLIVFFCVLTYAAQSQDKEKEKVKALLDVYQKNAQPFFREIVKSENKDIANSKENLDIALIEVRIEYLDALTIQIRIDVLQAVKEKNISDNTLLVALIEDKYRQKYSALPQEFFTKAEAEIKEKKLFGGTD